MGANNLLVAARLAANKTRAEWLLGLAEGRNTPQQLPVAACQPDGEPLLRLRLRTVVMSTPGFGLGTAKQLEEHLAQMLGGVDAKCWRDSRHNPKWTVAWLVDARAGGKRITAWLDAWRARTPPWPGFPYSKAPT
jgi:hypothetical protein